MISYNGNLWADTTQNEATITYGTGKYFFRINTVNDNNRINNTNIESVKLGAEFGMNISEKHGIFAGFNFYSMDDKNSKSAFEFNAGYNYNITNFFSNHRYQMVFQQQLNFKSVKKTPRLHSENGVFLPNLPHSPIKFSSNPYLSKTFLPPIKRP